MLEISELLVNFDFDEISGKLTWKVSNSNRVKVGDEPSYINNSGYRQVRVGGKLILVHRILFLLYHGYLPKYIDHKNGNRLDNSKENLRESTSSQNNSNKAGVSASSTLKGVYKCKGRKTWQAEVRFEGERRYKGSFKSEEAAHIWYIENAKDLQGDFYYMEATR